MPADLEEPLLVVEKQSVVCVGSSSLLRLWVSK